MSYREQFIAAWATQQQRAFHQSSRGIMTPEPRELLEREAESEMRKIEREAAARALAEIRREIRSIPHWWNSEEQCGGFDLQPLGPDASSEEGAFMEVMRVLDARAAEIR